MANVKSNTYYLKNPDYFLELEELIEKHFKYGKYVFKLRTSKYEHLLKWLIEQTPMLQKFGCNIPTMCYWVMHDIHDFPKCANCGQKMTKNVINFRDGYQMFCCNRCQITSKKFKDDRTQTWRRKYNDETITTPLQAYSIKEKIKKTCLEKYGVECCLQNQQIKEKVQFTKEKRYGSKTFVNPEKAKQTKIKKYGTADSLHCKKAKQTCQIRYECDNYASSQHYKIQRKINSQQKYGVDDPNQAPIVKQKQIAGVKKKYGKQYSNAFQVPDIRQKIEAQRDAMNEKRHETMKLNGSYRSSKSEEMCFHILHFAYPRLIRQHHTKKYPFACDFYDPDSNTYFEFNGTWTHSGHFFDENNKEDQKKLELWKSKNTKYYENAIKTWTVRDVAKRRCAIENKLNYVVFWSIDEACEYVLNAFKYIH